MKKSFELDSLQYIDAVAGTIRRQLTDKAEVKVDTAKELLTVSYCGWALEFGLGQIYTRYEQGDTIDQVAADVIAAVKNNYVQRIMR